MSVAFEDNLAKRFQDEALAEARTEHVQYFEAIEKHPRLLVGTQVPAIGKEGFETIQSTEDARDWQEAVKQILVQEVREKALVQMRMPRPETTRGTLNVTLAAHALVTKERQGNEPMWQTMDRMLDELLRLRAAEAARARRRREDEGALPLFPES